MFEICDSGYILIDIKAGRPMVDAGSLGTRPKADGLQEPLSALSNSHCSLSLGSLGVRAHGCCLSFSTVFSSGEIGSKVSVVAGGASEETVEKCHYSLPARDPHTPRIISSLPLGLKLPL